MECGSRRAAPDWPPDVFPAGSRVTVRRDPAWDGPWQREFHGMIDGLRPPSLLRHAQARAGELAYWVRLDEPEFGSAGDGPHRKAQNWGRYPRPEPRDGSGRAADVAGEHREAAR